jgi:hypothetical protein
MCVLLSDRKLVGVLALIELRFYRKGVVPGT